MRCVAWTETQEPEVTPAPLETGHISVEEENVGVWQNNFESNVDFFEDDGLPKVRFHSWVPCIFSPKSGPDFRLVVAWPERPGSVWQFR